MQKDKALAVQRVRRMTTSVANGVDLVGWLVDNSFLEKNGKALSDLEPGSVLLWNPGRQGSGAGRLPAG